MCRVIAVANQKGGVGKTVTCVNLGIGLAREGQRVLLIDSDPQGSLTISLGCDEPDKLDGTLASILLKVVNDEEVSPKENIRSHTEGVDYLAGNIELSGLEISLNGVISRETILVCAIICRYVVPYVKEKIKASKYSYILEWAKTAVEAAEQTISGGGHGSDKKFIVKNFLMKLCEDKNI